MSGEPTLIELRNAAIAKRDRAITTINEKFASDCAAEDSAHDREFDRVREEFDKLRKRPRPDHALLRSLRDEAIAEAETQLDAECFDIYRLFGVGDNRDRRN